jgi:hypothetical protein
VCCLALVLACTGQALLLQASIYIDRVVEHVDQLDLSNST